MGIFGRLFAVLLWTAAGFASSAWAAPDKSIEFKADKYFRDARNDSITGKGNAWTRKGDKEIRADEIHVDFRTQQTIATGNVKIKDGNLEVWCSQANFSLAGDEASFQNATLAIGQIVVTGESIQKFDATHLEIEQATYSNCNVELFPPDQAAQCPMDWRISGRRFRIEIGEYMHLYDVLIQAKSVPVFYIPYMLLPLKTGRQTGILPLVLTSTAALGTGVSVPFFWAINEWQDLLTTYTYFSKTGSHLGLRYRYAYDPMSKGHFNTFLLGQKFGGDEDPNVAPGGSQKMLGLFGEGAINLHNVFTFPDRRTQTRQMVNLVTHPFYSFNYLGDLPARADLGYLRNQITFSHPSDHLFTAAQLQYFQPLIVSKDSGVDRGAVIQLPTLSVSRGNDRLFHDWFAYEFDSQFTNYHRSTDYDDVPANPVLAGPQTDASTAFDGDDYVRTGRRLQLEPRLVVNVPLPTGFQLQPVIKAGALLYHFSTPQSEALSRYYLQTEIPFSFQLAKTFSTSFQDYQKVQHVFQPRAIFASDLYPNPKPSHPFFRTTSPLVSNPPFDELDLMPHFQYFRFELINRFRAKDSSGNWRRFFLLQMSEQLNLRTEPSDPRFRNKLGPIELLGSLNMGRFSWQMQAMYPLEMTTTLKGQPLFEPVRQTTFSSGVSYSAPGSDLIQLNLSFYKNADPSLTNHTLSMHWYKYLPLFFDIEASVEYNLLRGNFRSYGMGFHFRRKPRSCWHLSLNLSRNAFAQTFTQFAFGFDFGSY